MSDEATTSPVLPTTQSRWRRNLRMGVSAFFGLATVALCVLWVRSYFVTDLVELGTTTAFLMTASSESKVLLVYGQKVSAGYFKWTTDSDWHGFAESTYFGFHFSRGQTYWQIIAPLPSVIAVTFLVFVIAGIPAVSGRFSLRTLLIATTLIAVVMGLGVWLVR